MNPQLNPTRIIEVGEGFMASKTLLSAVELELFTVLGEKPLSGTELAERLSLHSRAVPDFPDALVSLGFLDRDGEGPDARYSNTPDTAAFLDKASPAYMGGLLEMCNVRLYPFWAHLTEGLRTGLPQNEAKGTGQPMYEALYAHPEQLEQFLAAMAGASIGVFVALAESFDFTTYRTLCDVGGASAQLSLRVAERHPHMRCTSFDLPAVEPFARAAIAATGATDRVTTAAGNFFTDALPRADVITMSLILNDLNLDQKNHLIRQAYDALPSGGSLVSIAPLIDDARRSETFGLLMSLNMLIEFGDAFSYTGADFTTWCKAAGFDRVDTLPLVGPVVAHVARK